ncbi:MAG TPA: sigma 54-interacting transcriptional regulator [Kofleriaceae bacterium]|nr:sigma 54-interacting transcriptional regulator [Kofleriaceae bacterium]
MAAPRIREVVVLGRYRVVERVGTGSFGRVLRVIDERSGEPRALKLAARDEAGLLDEFEQLARLRHPSLPRVHEIGRTTEVIDDVAAGAPFFIADWIAGGRSDAREPAAWSARALWGLLADISGALSVIHAAGLVHGDVSPANVLVVGDTGADARAVLVDLGLASGSGARGTPAYMAPEALAGHVEPRSDLYALGASAVRLVTGQPLVDAPTLGELVQRAITRVDAPALPGLPRPLADLIGRMVARDADARPSSALAVLDELDQLAATVTRGAPDLARRARPDVAPPPVAAAWPGAAELVDQLARGLATAVLHVVVGHAASGARQLVDAAVRRWQLAEIARHREPAPLAAGTLDELAVRFGVTGGGGWLDRLTRAARDAIVIVELGDDPRTDDALAALSRHAGGRPVIAIVDAAPRPREHVVAYATPVLDHAGVRAIAEQMIAADRGSPPDAWVRGLREASGGLALTAIELVRSIAGEPQPYAIDWAARTTAGAAELRGRQLRATSEPARRLAAAIAAWGGRVRIDRALATARASGARLAEVVELERAGLARRAGDEVVIDRATCEAAEPDAALAAAGLAIADGASIDQVTALLSRAPLDAALADRACDVAELLLARGRADRARSLAQRVLDANPGSAAPRARAALIAARAAAAAADYREVAPLARLAREAGADASVAELVVARAAQRAGMLDDAEAMLASLYAAHPDHAEIAGTYARLLVTRSRFADARRVARGDGGPLAGLRAEAAGLAAFYLGELDEADRAFAALEAGGDDAIIGRALSLRGMVAQQRGQLALASERYREAARKLGDVGEVHAAATAELNLGTVLVERGRASEALPRLAAASRVLGDLGVTHERVAADLNRGSALLAVGEARDARAAAEAAVAHADGAPHLRAFALIVLGDALVRLGDAAAAEASYREALAIGRERDDAHAQVSAHIALAETGHGSDGVDVAALCASADDRDRWTLACGRLALATSSASIELARACSDVATRAGEADRLERAFRGHALAAQLAQRAHDGALARVEAERARAVHAAMIAAAAPAFRAALEADVDLGRLPPGPAKTRAPATAPRIDDTGRRLLTLSRRLNTEDSVERILDEVIDTAIELTAAERGFLLLRQPKTDGGLAATPGEIELAPVVSRNFAMSDLARDDRSVSRSIAERAAQTGEPVLTVDAGHDERFAIAASVAALRLRSVLAVPLRQRGTITGCIYVDHRLRGGAFDEAAAAVLGELADIAAIAIENARLADDLRRSTREVDELNRRLSSELADRDAELVRVKADLPDRDRLRHRYEQIIGRSPAMVRMLDVVDRAAATSLPVVIVGESGTGKELVARALHDHGPRRDGAFVAINCSAVPEPLLESELFGHVRGAFTGADRDRRGLFEVADGGTLFLDEIADTSAAMQAKLLRVLQDGVLRRVGDTRTRKVDVRVIAASQRSLAELAAAGRFREDLRFRLEVIAVPIPPLRERDGDLPLLVEHLIARLAAGKAPPRISRAALRALGQHRWPGNVRELENALARGLAIGGDVIDLPDLPEAVAAAAARPEPGKPATGDDLHLKPALVATEQAYIAAAMSRAKNNQTVAARLLGLSRFGLQKKLRRLSGEDPGEDDE